MEGKEAIIARILGDAEKRAETILSEAENNAAASLGDAREWAERYKKAQRALLEKETESVVSGRKIVAGLDCRKVILRAKREVIDGVFSRALEKALNFGKERYLAVVERLIGENAEKGDVVFLAKSAPFGEDELMALPVVKALGLQFGGRGDFDGGVYLTNGACDKDLSFRSIVAERKEELETVVAASVFART